MFDAFCSLSKGFLFKCKAPAPNNPEAWQRVRREDMTSNCSVVQLISHKIVQRCFSKDLSVKLKYGDDRDGQADREANAAEMTDQQEAEELEKEEPKGWEHPDLYLWPDHGYVWLCCMFKFLAQGRSRGLVPWCPGRYDYILLMDEILHHLGWLKPYK